MHNKLYSDSHLKKRNKYGNCVFGFFVRRCGRGNFGYGGLGKCINQNWLCYAIVINLDINGLAQQNVSFYS